MRAGRLGLALAATLAVRGDAQAQGLLLGSEDPETQVPGGESAPIPGLPAAPERPRLLVVGPLRDCETSQDYDSLLACDDSNARVFESSRIQAADPDPANRGVPRGWLPHPDPRKSGWFISPEGVGLYARSLPAGREPPGPAQRAQAGTYRAVLPEIAALRATLYFKGLKRLVSRQAERELDAPPTPAIRSITSRNARLVKIPNAPEDAKDVSGMFAFANGDADLSGARNGAPARRGTRRAPAGPGGTAAAPGLRERSDPAARAATAAAGPARPEAPAPPLAPASVAPMAAPPAAAPGGPGILPVAARALGRTRRPAGWILLALGAALVARESLLSARAGRRRDPSEAPLPEPGSAAG